MTEFEDRAAKPGTSNHKDDTPLDYYIGRTAFYAELLRQVRDCGQDVRGTALMDRIYKAISHIPSGYNLPNAEVRRRIDEAERQ